MTLSRGFRTLHSVAVEGDCDGDPMRVITTTKGQTDLPRWFAASFELLKGLEAGRIDIVLPDGRAFRVEGHSN